jgi:hypothetical protein
MEAKYGQLTKKKSINQTIYECFNFLDGKEQNKFVAKFKQHPYPERQFMHTFSELILGAYLISNSIMVEYEHKIDLKKPDWSILDKSLNVAAIIENVYLHIDDKTEKNILAQKKARKIAIGYRVNGNDPNRLRLYENVKDKTSEYKDLITKKDVPYVVAISLDFEYPIDDQDFIDCLLSGEESLFMLYPYLSGFIKFEVFNRGTYRFQFLKNTEALHKIDIPSGNLF